MNTYTFTFDEKEFEITHKEKLLAMKYVENGFRVKDAAIAAGYSAKTASVSGSRALSRANVKAYVDYLKANLAEHIGISAFQIAEQLKAIGFVNLQDMFDDKGNVRNIKELPKEVAAALSSFEIGVDPETGERSIKVKANDKLSALRDLVKLLGYKEVEKVAQVNSKGEDVAPTAGANFVVLNAKDLPDELLEKIVYGNKG